MAAASKVSIKSQTKSISLPCRSHPTTFQIEELINKIKTTSSEAVSADAICSSLSQVTTLYKCMDNLLTSSTSQVLMSSEQNKKWVDELVDESVKFLDICGNVRDMLSEIKDHNRDLYSALKRRKGDSYIINSVMKYNCFRKKMKKDVKRLVANLKQVDNMVTGFGSVVVESDNHQLAAMIRAVVGVSKVTIMVLESLLTFFCVPVSKPNRWSIVVSKLTHKGRVACEEQLEKGVVNDLESIDVALNVLCKHKSSCDPKNVHIAQCRLETLEAEIESIHGGLESVFRCLVRTRVSLLNIISQ
ncbi:BPS1, chloroplastic-like protein [Tanacetum coccineum]